MEEQPQNTNQTPPPRSSWPWLAPLLALVGILGASLRWFLPSTAQRSVTKQWQEVESEAKEALVQAESELTPWIRRWQKYTQHAVDTFVPHIGNGFKPKALRSNALKTYALLLIISKLIVVGTLFFLYPNPAHLSETIVRRVIELANGARSSSQVTQLTADPALTAAAERKLQDMIDKSYFSHDSPDGRKPWQFIDRSQYDYLYAGENLAMDFTTAEIVHDAFMASPSHRRNIVNNHYNAIGVAMGTGYINGKYTTLLVQMFGSRKLVAGGPAPRSVSTSGQPQTAPGQPVTVQGQQLQPVTPSEPAPVITQPTPVPAPEPIAVNNQPVAVPPQDTLAQAEAPGPLAQAEAPTQVTVTRWQLPDTFAGELVAWSHRIFFVFVLFLVAALLINIFVQVRIQHTRLILQSLLVILLGGAVWLSNFHFLEQVSTDILISREAAEILVVGRR